MEGLGAQSSSWNALKSLPGGLDQAVHYDFPTFETGEAIITRNWVQASIIVSLMDETQLRVYPGCFGGQVEKGKAATITLAKGQVILFRGNLAHAGAKYDTVNYRLHFYIIFPDIPQQEDAIEAFAFKSYRCDKGFLSVSRKWSSPIIAASGRRRPGRRRFLNSDASNATRLGASATL